MNCKLAILMVASALPMVAQSGGGISFDVSFNSPMGKAVTGKPYAIEQVSESTQTLADGTHITQSSGRTKLYRDSAGRTRIENFFRPPPGMDIAMPSTVQIMDPVAGFHYMINGQNREVRRSAWPSSGVSRAISSRSSATAAFAIPTAITPPPPPPPPSSSSRRTQTSRENLGTQTIEGVLAEGTRITSVYPEGAVGNDRPITTIHESWMSVDLGLSILSKSSDPRNGDRSTRTVSISQSEPDPALFQIPADYTVIDQPAPGGLR